MSLVNRKLVVAITVGWWLVSLSAFALGAGDPQAAKPIVAEYCVKCHAVPTYNPAGGPASVSAPSFETIAAKPEVYTEERLRTFLRRPHFPMQGLVLSDQDVTNLIAFIQSLRP
jgi:cytochrome c553